MGDILDLIDGAVAAHELSGDAMRWTPEAQAQPTLSVIDETHHWLETQRYIWQPVLDGDRVWFVPRAQRGRADA